MLIKDQCAQEVDQMRDLEKKDMGKGFFFFLCTVIKPGWAKDRGTLIPSAVEIFSGKIKGNKSFVYSFFSCLD